VIPAIRKVRATHDDLSQVQDNVHAAWESMRQKSGDLLDNNKLRVTLKAGSNLIAHGLARAYTFAFFTLPSSGALTEGASPDRTQYVNVIATAPCTVGILVF